MSSPVESQFVNGSAVRAVVARDVGANGGPKLGDQSGSREAAINSNDRQTDASTHLTESERVTVRKLDAALTAVGSVNMGIFLEQGSGQPIIKIFNKESGEEIFQIPAKHSLHIANTVEFVKGLIFDKKV